MKDNTEQELVYRAIGGNPNKPFVGSINADTQTPISIDISVWQSSCDTTNMQLIDAESQTVIPIYELVEDFAKKEQLKAAVMKYIRDKSYIDVGDPIPLYRIFMKEKFIRSMIEAELLEIILARKRLLLHN